MITIAVANQKGGVGKTTTAVTLAHGLALRNYRVLLVDLDPQGQCASHLGMKQEGGVFDLLVSDLPLRDVVRTTGRPRLWLLPGNKKTKTAETLMVIERCRISALRQVLDERINGKQLHFCILDTAPSVGGLQENALYAADLLLVPSAVDNLSLEGVRSVIMTLRAVRSRLPVLRIVPTFYDRVTKESKANLERLVKQFGDVVTEPIHRATALRECPALGSTIFEHREDCRAAREYGNLVWEVIDATG